MRKTMLYAVVFASILILGSFIVVAKNENAPGQWKKDNGYADQREFVRSIHMRIRDRIQERNDLMGRNVNPVGLLKLINEWMTELETGEELEEEESEEEESEEEEYEEEESEEEEYEEED